MPTVPSHTSTERAYARRPWRNWVNVSQGFHLSLCSPIQNTSTSSTHRRSLCIRNCVCVCLSVLCSAELWDAVLQGGLETGRERKRERTKKEVRREWFFSLLFPWVLQQGFSLELPHFISCCAYVCARMCVCSLRACVNYAKVLLHRGDL